MEKEEEAMMGVAIASSKACSSVLYTLITPFNRSKSMLACSGSSPDRKRRSLIFFGSSLVLASTLLGSSNQQNFPVESAIALEQMKEKEEEEEEVEEEEERNVNLFQVFEQSKS